MKCPECKQEAIITRIGSWLLCTKCKYSWLSDPSRTYNLQTGEATGQYTKDTK